MSLDITPSTKLSDWSIDWIKQILDQNLHEGYLYDFKKELSSKDESISKAVASFANTVGGFIIFGIIDNKSAVGWERLHGVKDKDEFSKKLSDRLAGAVPSIFFADPLFIVLDNDGKSYDIAIVKIESSAFKPHALVNNDGLLRFWNRNNQTAIAMTYPALVKSIEESTQLRNWLAALYLDTEYIDSFADQMVMPEADRETSIPLVQIKSLVNSDQSSQIISIIPNDVSLVKTIWELRNKIDIVNSYRDMMVQRRSLPLSNAKIENKNDNDRLASIIPSIKQLTSDIREHLIKSYPKIREWLSIVKA